mmetsp:Transcript_18960/g.72382  ORF Transcript_18960/g.72382 Transcript_18960/m.72382 type:complete len:259 (+) Transcript_18960:572-1348(+)
MTAMAPRGSDSVPENEIFSPAAPPAPPASASALPAAPAAASSLSLRKAWHSGSFAMPAAAAAAASAATSARWCALSSAVCTSGLCHIPRSSSRASLASRNRRRAADPSLATDKSGEKDCLTDTRQRPPSGLEHTTTAVMPSVASSGSASARVRKQRTGRDRVVMSAGSEAPRCRIGGPSLSSDAFAEEAWAGPAASSASSASRGQSGWTPGSSASTAQSSTSPPLPTSAAAGRSGLGVSCSSRDGSGAEVCHSAPSSP